MMWNQKIAPAESPAVGRTIQKRQSVKIKSAGIKWGIFNLAMAVLVYCEMSFGPSVKALEMIGGILWYIECCLLVVFSVNALVNAFRYVCLWLNFSVVELTPIQFALLGVKKSETGFRTPFASGMKKPVVESPGLVISPSTYSAQPSFMAAPYSPTNSPFIVSPGHSPPQHFSPNASLSPLPKASRSLSPGQLSTCAGSPSFSNSPSSSFLLSNSAHLNKSHSYAANQSLLGNSLNRSAMSPLSTTNTLSPLFKEADTSGVRSRFSNVSIKNSPLKPEDCMTDLRELDEFLREQEEKDMRHQLGGGDSTTTGTGPSFWSFNRSFTDFSPMLRKYTYQLACRSPQSTKAKDDDTDDGPAQYEAKEVWLRAGVHVDDVDIWIEHLRKWLGQTIMRRLMTEIAAVNARLEKLGCEDMQIGEIGISTLKQLAVTKSNSIPTLNALIPFLEVTQSQEYLVHRIKELGSSGCMSDFKWNGGSDFKGKAWGEHWPTDAEIVMHALCCYMDARLPPHPKCYGKTFSTLHFMKTPDKPDLTKKDNLLIYQTKIHPPHYKVVLTDDIYNLPKGRNNIFFAILYFLYHIKEKEHGMLGRVNLGLSGINILWILDTHL